MVNPVRNSSRCDSKPSGASNPGIILGPNPAADQQGFISNGVNRPAAYHWLPDGELSGSHKSSCTIYRWKESQRFKPGFLPE